MFNTLTHAENLRGVTNDSAYKINYYQIKKMINYYDVMTKKEKNYTLNVNKTNTCIVHVVFL